MSLKRKELATLDVSAFAELVEGEAIHVVARKYKTRPPWNPGIFVMSSPNISKSDQLTTVFRKNRVMFACLLQHATENLTMMRSHATDTIVVETGIN